VAEKMSVSFRLLKLLTQLIIITMLLAAYYFKGFEFAVILGLGLILFILIDIQQGNEK